MTLDYISESEKLVNDFFKEEPYKAQLWWNTKNPMLGNIRPIDMIKCGREKKLYQFIKSRIEQNP